MTCKLAVKHLSCIQLLLAITACSGDDTTGNADSGTVSAAEIVSAGQPTALRDSSAFFVGSPSAVAVSSRFIFIADAGTASILQYDRSGQPVRRIGRRGNGPGELMAPTALVALGDTALAVADAGSNRIMIFETDSGNFRVARQLRSNPFTVSISGDTILAATYDATQKTSMYRAFLSDTGGTAFGPVSMDYANSRRTRFAYPFSVASLTDGGAVVGLVASSWLYRTNPDGMPIDSVRLVSRTRRGVPDDLEAQLENNKSQEAEMQLVSVLMSISTESQRSRLLHADFRPDGQGEAARAFLSVVNWANHRQCVDAEVPVAESSRPAFSFRNDTLVVAQNVIQAGDSSAVTMISLFRITPC